MDENKELKDNLKKAKDRLKNLGKKETSSDKGFWRKEVIAPIILVLVVAVFIGMFFWAQKIKEEKKG